MALSEKQVLRIFRRAGAFQEGHFQLSSGLHSAGYWQCALVLQYPRLAARLCKALAEPWRDERVDAVIGPALGGITLAYELARALKARGLFMERQDGKLLLRRSFQVSPGERVLLAEDVMTTGGSVGEMVDALKPTGAEIIGIACLVDRGGSARFSGYRVHSLIRVALENYSPGDCPLCRQGIPVVKPGSRK